MLTSTEIASMRAVLDDSLPDRAVIERATLVDNGAGGQTPTWAAAGTVLARVSPAQAQATEAIGAGDEVSARNLWTVTFPHGTDVRATDRVVFDSTTLDVLGVDTPRSWALGVRVSAVRRT